MFGRYSERAQRAIILAQDEARRLNYQYVGTEHILLGLLREKTGIAAKALENLGLDLEQVRAGIEKTLGRGSAPITGEIQFTPRGKRVLMELAIEEARNLGHSYVGTEHLLLGLLREGECASARLLTGMGVDLEKARLEVTKLLGKPTQPGPPAVPAATRHQPPEDVATATLLPRRHVLLQASAVVLDSAGRVLLVRRGQDSARWSLPGGRPQPGEPLRAAAERVAYETTGVRVRCERLAWVVETIGGPEGNLRMLDFVYLGGATGGEPTPAAAYCARADVPPDTVLPPDFWEAADAGFTGHDPGVSRRVPEPEE